MHAEMANSGELRTLRIPFQKSAPDYTSLLRMSEGKSLVLLGEASHGSHEFYQARVDITKRLILEQGVQAIAVEADWPAAYRVNRYVSGLGDDDSALEALGDFQRFPLWMWRNQVIRTFIEWLREHNAGQPPEHRVGFYGLDMYSLYESIAVVINYLEKIDPEAAEQARQRYGCLDHLSDEQQYGWNVAMGYHPGCEDEVVEQLVELQRRAGGYVHRGGLVSRDEQFQIEQNARLIRNAEHYYRAMFDDDVSTWNLRDRHMTETLEVLRDYLSRGAGGPAKVVVWAHNSHLGDARATRMAERGEVNVGQLVRERFGGQALLVGFTTYTGSVSAASYWGGSVECKTVRPALPDSYEYLFHQLGDEGFFLALGDATPEVLKSARLERAIGVLYLPESELQSHYFRCVLADQFDAVLHFDETDALEPLDDMSKWTGRSPETYPFGV